MEFIPHQLHLTLPQVKKLLARLPFNIPYEHMGSGVGNEVIHLLPQNARKLLSAYRKNKGMRLQLTPHELEHTMKKGTGLNLEKILNSPVGNKIANKVVDKAIDKLVGGRVNVEKIMNTPIANKIIDKVIDVGVNRAFGGKLVKGSQEAKDRMAKMRAMRKVGKGDFFGNIGKAFTESWNRPPASKNEQDIANAINRNLIASAPSVFGRINPELGEAMSIPLDPYLKERERVDNSVKFGNGRKKKLGAGANTSAVFKKTLKNNFSGLTLNNVGDNQKSNATRNPKVKPSSDEMTMSPYQKMSSPAMNPFVPKYYTQEGGTSCGYGGRGLYAGGLF